MSDIIGNLLILAITVTLFTSILYFVSSMPGPQEKVYTDFVSTVSLDPATNTANITITHKGGDSLANANTNVFVFQDNNPKLFHISDGITGATSWSTGGTWIKTLSGVYYNTSLSIMIVDVEANTVVYTTNLMGGSQAAVAYPIIGDRGLSPAPTYVGYKVQFYAVINCPYAALNPSTIYVDASSLGLGNVALTDPDGDNVFWSDPAVKYTTSSSWNGKTVVVHAANTRGEQSEARLVLTVLDSPGGGGSSSSENPYYNYPGYLLNGTYPPDASGGEASGSVGITWYYIKNANGNITRNFTAGQQVFVEFWSDTLQNAGLQNVINLIHPLTGEVIYPQSSSSAFTYTRAYSTFRMFSYNFTAPTDSYTYSLQIKVKDNLGMAVNINDYIVVGSREYPMLVTYKADASGNLIKSTSFNHTDTVYVLIFTKDVDLSASTVTVSDLQVTEFSGQYVVQKSCPPYTNPPTYSDESKPISSVFKTNGKNTNPTYDGTGFGVYTFYMVLFDAYQGWWLPGTNTYTLRINTFMDQGTTGYGEAYYGLSVQFGVTAPLSTNDILASLGSGSFSWSASGASWTNNKVVWFQGGDQWDYTLIDGAPSAGPLALALFDVNGDGRNDAVVGSQSATSANIVYYVNEKIDGSSWSSKRIIANAFDAKSGIDIQNTSYSGFGYTYRGGTSLGNANEDATIFCSANPVNGKFVTYYDGTYYYSLNEICTQIAIADFDCDGDGDIVASFTHQVIYTTVNDPSDASSSNSWGMFFNRGVYVYWNDGNEWTRTALYSTMDWASNGRANAGSNPTAGDLAVGDLNQDGYPDIAAAYQTGMTKVWLNAWTSQTGDLLSREQGTFGKSVVNLDGALNVTGLSPWAHTTASQYQPCIEIADMNNDGYPDIVRTSTLSNAVYVLYTQLTGSDSVAFEPDMEYAVNSTLYASVTGSKANLRNVDTLYENLTEVYLNYANQTLYAQNKWQPSVNELSTTYFRDGQYYTVADNGIMGIYGYSPSSDYMSKTVSKALLKVAWSADPSYIGTSRLQYSTDGGLTWTNTAVAPAGGDSGKYVEINLLAAGIDTWSEINNIWFRFENVAGSGGAVYFDQVVLDTQFVQSRVMGWEWEIPNALRAHHNLTIVANITGSESFLIQYSVDNETWFDAFEVSSTTQKTYSLMLPYTPNDHYYVRVIDYETTDSETGTLRINQLIIAHSTQTVTWTAAERETSTYSSAITGLAVGDMDKRTGVYSSGLLDIVFSTASTTSYGSLYISTQATKGSFTDHPVVTTALAAACADATYDTHAVELGDVDGDGDLDVVLVVGATWGKDPGTAPTMWLYYNNQLFDTSSRWTFTEEPINALSTAGESAINIKLGYIDLTIFLPILGVVGIAAIGGALERRARKKE